MQNGKANSKKNNKNKNIRQAYNDLLTKHEDLVRSFMIMQRSMKLILLTKGKNEVLYYTREVAENYLDHHLDEMRLNIRENEELKRIEISL